MATRRQFKRRDEIVDAAAQVFAERGYHAASTQMIGDVLGMRQASLYYYFSSKEEALFEVCKIGVEGFVEGLQAIVEDGGLDFGEKVRRGILNHLMPLRERRPYVIVFLDDRNELPGANRKKIGRLSRRYERLWQQLIESGQRDGAFKPGADAKLVSYVILGICNASAPWLDATTRGVLETTADGFADLVLGGLKTD